MLVLKTSDINSVMYYREYVGSKDNVLYMLVQNSVMYYREYVGSKDK